MVPNHPPAEAKPDEAYVKEDFCTYVDGVKTSYRTEDNIEVAHKTMSLLIVTGLLACRLHFEAAP